MRLAWSNLHIVANARYEGVQVLHYILLIYRTHFFFRTTISPETTYCNMKTSLQNECQLFIIAHKQYLSAQLQT
jgi:hypothetical protein